MSPISPEIETKRNLRLSIGAGQKLLHEESDAAKVQHNIVVRTGRQSVTEYLQLSYPVFQDEKHQTNTQDEYVGQMDRTKSGAKEQSSRRDSQRRMRNKEALATSGLNHPAPTR